MEVITVYEVIDFSNFDDAPVHRFESKRAAEEFRSNHNLKEEIMEFKIVTDRVKNPGVGFQILENREITFETLEENDFKRHLLKKLRGTFSKEELKKLPEMLVKLNLT